MSAAPGGPIARALAEARDNPVLDRELRQGVRRGYAPALILLSTTLLSLLMAAIGGTLTALDAPAQIGIALYQTYFSLAFFLIVLVATASAASSVGAERDGRTWEALLLTGLSPTEVARGKLLATLVNAASYLVALAPVSALAFLFGGVTVVEIALAHLVLAAAAIVAATFGLALGAALERSGIAVLAGAVIAAPAALVAWSSLGFGLAFRLHARWAAIPTAPVWLPAAWTRVPVDATWLVSFVVVPVALAALPAWFFREAAVASLTSKGDDRSTRIWRFYVVATPALSIAGMAWIATSLAGSRKEAGFAAIGAYAVHLFFAAMTLAGEPLGPPRRVRARWEREATSGWRRALGPGLPGATALVVVVGLAGLGAITTLAAALAAHDAAPTAAAQVLAFGAYAAAFFLFLAGVAALGRATANELTARALVAGASFLALVGPWVVATFASVAGGSATDEYLLVAWSPIYAPTVLSGALASGAVEKVAAGALAAAVWLLLGGATLLAGLGRAAARVRAVEELEAQDEARFRAAEDEARIAEGAP